MLQEKQLQKDSPEHLFIAGMEKYFPISFWWSLSLTPLLGRDCFLNLSAIAVLTEDALKLFFLEIYFYQPPSETTPKWERPFMDV